MESVNEVTQTAATSANEMSSATEEMSRMAQDLRRLVEHFRIATGTDQGLPDAGGAVTVAEAPSKAV